MLELERRNSELAALLQQESQTSQQQSQYIGEMVRFLSIRFGNSFMQLNIYNQDFSSLIICIAYYRLFHYINDVNRYQIPNVS